MNFADKMKRQMGYITDKDYNEAVKVLGGDFGVVVKKVSGNREIAALKDLADVEKRIESEGDYVKEVFISASDFRRLF